MRENSAKATWKVKVLKLGQMDVATKVISRMEKKMGKEPLSGLLELNILVAGEMGNNME